MLSLALQKRQCLADHSPKRWHLDGESDPTLRWLEGAVRCGGASPPCTCPPPSCCPPHQCAMREEPATRSLHDEFLNQARPSPHKHKPQTMAASPSAVPPCKPTSELSPRTCVQQAGHEVGVLHDASTPVRAVVTDQNLLGFCWRERPSLTRPSDSVVAVSWTLVVWRRRFQNRPPSAGARRSPLWHRQEEDLAFGNSVCGRGGGDGWSTWLRTA